MIEKQLAATPTGLLGRHDALALGVQLDIVAEAAATRACGVLDYGSVHSPSSISARDSTLEVSTYTTGGSIKQDPAYAAKEFDSE
jgi:hypothetical protein